VGSPPPPDPLLTLAGRLKAGSLRALRLGGRTTLPFGAPVPGSVRFDMLTRSRGGALLARGSKSFAAAGGGRIAVTATARGRAWLRRHPAGLPYARVVWRPRGGTVQTVIVHLRR
jgi:hypothetical protein